MPGRFLVGVSVLVVHDGRVLLLRRRDDRDHGAGTWEPVSGRVEQGEWVEQAAVREVAEETGLEVADLHAVHTFGFVRQPSGEPLIGVCFAGLAASDDVRLSPEHTEARWHPVTDLDHAPVPDGVTPSLRAFTRLWRAGWPWGEQS